MEQETTVQLVAFIETTEFFIAKLRRFTKQVNAKLDTGEKPIVEAADWSPGFRRQAGANGQARKRVSTQSVDRAATSSR